VNLRDVEADSQRARYDFLIADSFATRAEADLAAGESDAAKIVLEKAEAGYATIRRLFPRLENNDERKEIEKKLNQLRAKLDALRPQAAQSR
jgi:hypothetical protein